MAHGRMSSAPAFRSSGDLLADRRYDYAAAALAERDFVAAADLFAQAAEVAPCWAAAWFGLGQAREALAQKDAAAEAFTRARECDAHDELGAGLHLARLTGASPASPPADYVRGLFDQYAGRFDRHLREELGYRGPELLRDALSAARAERSQPLHFDRVLDLGCGTGLMGRALFPHFDSIHGVDLSPGADYELGADLRYAHSAYLRRLAAARDSGSRRWRRRLDAQDAGRDVPGC
jgi:tetratricopeptide (TPR) repeat protein